MQVPVNGRFKLKKIDLFIFEITMKCNISEVMILYKIDVIN